MAPMPEGAIIEDEIQLEDAVVEAIRDALDDGNVKLKNASVALWGPNSTSKRLQVPDGTEQEVEDQVLWESEQYIPFGVDESQISHHVIGENEGGALDVIMAAGREDLIRGFQDLVAAAGLSTKLVDLSVMCLSNIFEFSVGKNRELYNDGTVIIEFGAQMTRVVVYKFDGPIYTKELMMGGSIITEEIQRQMGLNYDDAENLKCYGDESGNLPEEILVIINSALDTFISEIKKTLNFFLTASTEDKIRHCFITGGSSLLPGLAEGLEGILGIPIEELNPMSSLDFSERALGKEKVEFIKSQGAVALGLALRTL
jgi:type IV pilus assembly protein PilM